MAARLVGADDSVHPLPALYPVLRARFAGVIERNARNVLTDPYANALQADYHIWERKWEVDSLAWTVVLALVYWRSTRDRTVFTPDLHRALATIVATYACEATPSHLQPLRLLGSRLYRNAYNSESGMIWGAFRPSDDAVEYRFNIPQNAMAVVALRDIAELAADGYADRELRGAGPPR